MDSALESTLIARFRSGDQSAFGELFEAYNRRMISLAQKILRQDELALDAAQEVFIRAYEELPNWRGEARFSTWLYRTMVNVCFEKLRAEDKQRKLKDVPIDKEPVRGPEALAIDNEIVRTIDQAVQALPPRQRTVFVLKHYHELRFSEIASMLSLTEGGAKATHHKALLSLRAKLKELAPPVAHGVDSTVLTRETSNLETPKSHQSRRERSV